MKFNPDALKAFRAAQGLTIEQLAQRAGVTSSTIGRAERGSHTPDPNTVYSIAGALGVSISDLFEFEETAA